MRHHSLHVACAAMLLTLAFSIQASGQIDPSVGRALSLQLGNAEEQYHALKDREKSLSLPDRFLGTYEWKLIESNMDDCQSIILTARQQIHFLNYENAKQGLSKLEPLFEATKAILDEDARFSGNELRGVSVLDDNYAPTASLPNLQGPALRAAIGSEISFAQRVIGKSRVIDIDYAVALNGFPPAFGANIACFDAKKRFILRGVEIVKQLGNDDRRTPTSSESYFAIAKDELRLLHYKNAHDLASYAFTAGQEILSKCQASR
jgi:hypothetical protein